MNWIELAEDAIGGFLVSLVMVEVLRRAVGFRWPEQQAGFQLERRLMPWLLTLAAGPALLWDATAPYRRREVGGPADLLAVGFVLAIWSGSYGHCVASLARLVF